MRWITFCLFLIAFCAMANIAGFRPWGGREVDIERPTAWELTSITDMVVGPAAETLFIAGDDTIDGDLYLMGEGVVIVDSAILTLRGFLYQEGASEFILQPGSYLYLPQEYLVQYPHVMHDSSRFVATDATIDGKTIWQGNFYDRAEYICTRTQFTHWNFRKLWNSSRFVLEDANFVGDLTINDSCYVSLTRCDTILPWFGFEAGDEAILEFPAYDTVDYFTLDSAAIYMSGINYDVVIEDCNHVIFAIESWPNSSVTIQNSPAVCAAFRLLSDSTYIYGLHDHTFQDHIIPPFLDRVFELRNSYLHWWSWYSYGAAVLVMDSCRYGEAISRDSSHIETYRTISDGLPTSADALDDATFYIHTGEYMNTCSARNRGLLHLDETSVVLPPGHYSHQRENSAMNSSRLFCTNSYLDSLPFAMDSAIVLFAAIDSMDTLSEGDSAPINGSAWADFGPMCDDDFDRFALSAETLDSTWELMTSTLQIHDDTLTIFATEGLDGDVELRLTVHTVSGESLTAHRHVYISSMKIAESRIPKAFGISAHPNPFNGAVTITVEKTFLSVQDNATGKTGMSGLPEKIEIFDVNGRLIHVISMRALPEEKSPADREKISPFGRNVNKAVFIWKPDENITSGVYLVRATVGDGKSVSKRVVYLK